MNAQRLSPQNADRIRGEIAEGILLISPGDHVMAANPEIARWLGFASACELLACPTLRFCGLVEVSRENGTLVTWDECFLAPGCDIRSRRSAFLRWRQTDDPDFRSFQFNVIPILNDDGSLHSSLITTIDITEPGKEQQENGAIQAFSQSEMPYRILVAEDDSVSRLVMQKMLQRLGYQADFVVNGREALESCLRHAYDLVFMDCQMPELDGYTVASRLRIVEQESGKKAAFIVAMTADGFASTRLDCESSGMDGYIAKPVMSESLQEMIFRANRGGETNVFHRHPSWNQTAFQKENLDLALLNRLHELVESDQPGQFQELLSGFLLQSESDIANLVKLAIAGNFAALAKAAHGLKGLSLNFGAISMARESETLQRESGVGDVPAALKFLSKLELAFARTRIAVSGLTDLRVYSADTNMPAQFPEEREKDG